MRDLTQELQTALEKLILNIPSPDLAKLVRDVEQLYLPELKAYQPDAPELALGRSIAECVEHFRAHRRRGGVVEVDRFRHAGKILRKTMSGKR